MATFSANKGYTIPTVGADVGQWGTELNNTIGVLDTNMGGNTSINCAGSSNVTLTTPQAQNLALTLTGALTGNIELIVPNLGGFYIVNNLTTGAFTVTVISAAAAASVVAPQGFRMTVLVDASGNVYSSTDANTAGGGGGAFSSLTVSGTVSGAGFTNLFASPPSIGNTAANTGAFTTLSTSGIYTAAAGIDIPNNKYINFANTSGTYAPALGVGTDNNLRLAGGTAGGIITNNAGSVNLHLWSDAGIFNYPSGTALTIGADNDNPIPSQVGAWSFVGNGVAAAWATTASAPLSLGVSSNSTPLLAFWSTIQEAGTITTNGTNVSYGGVSDGRLKIKDFRLGAEAGDIIDKIRAIWFRWKVKPDAAPEPGFFAQQVYKIFPWAVIKGSGRPGRKGFRAWQIDASKMMPIVIAELQQLRKRVAELEKRGV